MFTAGLEPWSFAWQHSVFTELNSCLARLHTKAYCTQPFILLFILLFHLTKQGYFAFKCSTTIPVDYVVMYFVLVKMQI